MKKLTRLNRAFTLIEVLIVITIITMLSAVVIIAVNPARQFAQARNTQRWVAVNSILNGVQQNMLDNGGSFDFTDCGATTIPATATGISSVGGVDLCDCLVPTYLSNLPHDPLDGSYTSCTTYDIVYTIHQDATTGRMTIAVPSGSQELGVVISVTR